MKKYYITIVIAFLSISTFAQSPAYEWAKNAGGTFADEGKGVTTDSQGNILVTGYFQSPTITFGSTVLTTPGVFVVKYDPLGNVLWANGSGASSAMSQGNAIAVDTNGNVFVTGFFQSGSLFLGSTILTNAGNEDVFIVKYDAAGNLLWAKSAGGSLFDFGSGITTDVNGNVFVSGYYWSSSILFGSVSLSNNGGADVFAVAYDVSGNVIWARSAGGTFNDRAFGIGVDVNGNAAITGSFESASITFDGFTLSNPNPGTSDLFVAQFNALGTINWAKRTGGTNSDLGYSIAIDINGNVLIAGEFWSSSLTFGSTTLNNVSPGTGDVLVLKYDSTGVALWAKSAGGVAEDEAFGIATDIIGNVYITGLYQSPTITFGSNTLSGSSLFIVKYDAVGAIVWANDAVGVAVGYGINTTTDGSIIVTGYLYSSTVTFGTTILSNNGSEDLFVAKLSTTTGMQEKMDNSMVNIFPNPFSSQAVINFSEEQREVSVKIIDIFGKEIKEMNFSGKELTIQRDEMINGVYFIQIVNENGGVVTKKIVIQ